MIAIIILFVINFTKSNSKILNNFFLIFLSFLTFLCLIFFMKLIFPRYALYIRSSSIDFRQSRFNPFLKQFIIIIYFLISLKIEDKKYEILRILKNMRIYLLLLSSLILFLLNATEMTSRILIYFIAFDAAYFSYLIFKSEIKILYKSIYFFSVILSPSITTILLL